MNSPARRSKIADPLHRFFLEEVSLADASPTGRMYAIRIVGIAKRDFPANIDMLLPGFLYAWNERSGCPFTREQVKALLLEPALPKEKKPKKKDRPTEDVFAVSLFKE